MVRDMGRAFAACPSTHTMLNQIRDEMFKSEAIELQQRGYSASDYTSFWDDAFAEGKSSPVEAGQCDSELSTWKLMLKNIRER